MGQSRVTGKSNRSEVGGGGIAEQTACEAVQIASDLV